MTGAEKLFDAITEVRSDYIEAAGDYQFARKKRKMVHFRRYLALAACFALIFAGVLTLGKNLRMGSTSGDSSGNMNTAPPPDNGDWIGNGDWNGSGDWPAGIGGANAGSDGNDDPASADPKEPGGETDPGGVSALKVEGETETLTGARSLKLIFGEAGDNTVQVRDSYVLTNTGTESCTITVYCGGAELVGLPQDAEVLEGNACRIGIPAGCTAELVLESVVVVENGVLNVEKPQGLEMSLHIETEEAWIEGYSVNIISEGELLLSIGD